MPTPRALLLLSGLILYPFACPGQVTVAMAQYNVERTGANLNERVLNPSTVSAEQFGKLFTRNVDDSVYALPLVVAGLDVGGKPRNVLFVATMSNTVYAFDADDPKESKPLWTHNLGLPAAGDGWIGPVNLGILSTPFIDLPSGTLYAVTKNRDPEGATVSVHALDLKTGRPKFNSPRLLSFPFEGEQTELTHVPDALQRAGLLVIGDTLYVASASIKPGDAQEGFVQSFNARDLRERRGSFQVTPTGLKGGIWQAGRGIAADSAGNLYVATAGGTFDGEKNFGASILKLPGTTLRVADWFTPANFDDLFHGNIDPSAGGVTLIPDSTLLFAGGKEGVVYLLNREDMGSLEGAGKGPLQRFQASKGCGMRDCAQTLGTAFWSRGGEGTLYVWDKGDVLRAYRYADRRFETAPFSTGMVVAAITGGPSVSADGSDASSGIVWAVTADVDGTEKPTPGTLRAFLASDVSKQLYSSQTNVFRDELGDLTKMAAPVVANGKVYVPTQSGQVAVYGMLPGSAK